MKVKQVTVVAPTKSRMLPKLGIVSAMNNRMRTAEERNTQRFHPKSCKRSAIKRAQVWLDRFLLPSGIFRANSQNCAGGFVRMGNAVMRCNNSMISTTRRT